MAVSLSNASRASSCAFSAGAGTQFDVTASCSDHLAVRVAIPRIDLGSFYGGALSLFQQPFVAVIADIRAVPGISGSAVLPCCRVREVSDYRGGDTRRCTDAHEVRRCGRCRRRPRNRTDHPKVPSRQEGRRRRCRGGRAGRCRGALWRTRIPRSCRHRPHPIRTLRGPRRLRPARSLRHCPTRQRRARRRRRRPNNRRDLRRVRKVR